MREAALRVGRTPETVRRWIWSGRLSARKRGNVLYIAERDLAGIAAPAETYPPSDRPTLASWLAEVDAWRAASPGDGRSAADLVLADRVERAGR